MARLGSGANIDDRAAIPVPGGRQISIPELGVDQVVDRPSVTVRLQIQKPKNATATVKSIKKAKKSSKKPLYYTLADCVAAKLLTGKVPQIEEAIVPPPRVGKAVV